ncbi:hypothetical protein Tco_1305925, partial [Tanacetum coccineum]
GRSSDDEHIPKNDRFSKNGYKAVPPPITGNFLTLRADISFAGPVSTARPVSTVRPSISTARPSVSIARPSVSTTRPVHATRPTYPMVQNMTDAGTRAAVITGKGKLDTDLKKSRWVWRPKGYYLDHVSKDRQSRDLVTGSCSGG